jgi:ferredoxin
MAGEGSHFHYVATRAQAAALIAAHDKFWVSNCGCREGGPGCNHSRLDVCLFFDPQMGGTGGNFREVDRAFAEGILREAEEKHLVCRPFRYDKDRARTQGVCFCCECCGYFPVEEDACDRGRFREQTDITACGQCGACADVCYFGARAMTDGELAVASEKCYGCALCLDVCPDGCIEMVAR